MDNKEARKILEEVKKVLEARAAATGRFVDIAIHPDHPYLTFRDLKNEEVYRRFLEKEFGKDDPRAEMHPPYGRSISYEDGEDEPWYVFDWCPNEDYSGGVMYRKVESALWMLTMTLADKKWLGGDQPHIYYVEIDEDYETMLLALRLGSLYLAKHPVGPKRIMRTMPIIDAREYGDHRRWDSDEEADLSGIEFRDPRK